MEHKRDEVESAKVVLLHGFTKEQIFAIMRAVKRELEPAENVAFAMTTPNSLQMKTADLIQDIQGDHAYLKKNPPVQATHPDNV